MNALERRKRPRGCYVCWALLCLGLVILGCEAAEPPQDAQDGAGESGSWLRTARRAHQVADDAKTVEQRGQAVAELEEALQALPAHAPGVDWVRLDLGARLAQLQLEQGDARSALSWVQRVMPKQPEPSVPAANLLVVAGRAYEQLGNEKQAVESYHQALVMNQTLMERSLEGL